MAMARRWFCLMFEAVLMTVMLGLALGGSFAFLELGCRISYYGLMAEGGYLEPYVFYWHWYLLSVFWAMAYFGLYCWIDRVPD